MGKKRPLWTKLTSAGGFAGAVYLEGEQLLLDFDYSPERVQQLKGVGRAKFQAETKRWALPLEKLPELKLVELFQPGVIRYYVDERDLSLSAVERQERRSNAAKAIHANPFSVLEEELIVAPVDVQIRLTDRRMVLFQPKYRSKAGRLLARMRGPILSRRERGFIVQAHRVGELLKLLREKEQSFAVEQGLSLRLRESADLRSRILESGKGSIEEFRAALLSPILAVSSEDDALLELLDWIPEHLQILLPNIETFPERKKKIHSLTHEELPELFDRGAPFRIWVESELASFLGSSLPRAHEALEAERERLRERNREFERLSDFPLDTSVLPDPSSGEKLFPHQRVAVHWLLENPRALLGDDMGLGKTLTVLMYQELLRAKGEIDFLLVVCPNSLKRNWLREGEQWFPGRKLLLVPEKKSERAAFFRHLRYGARLADGLVVNFEAVRLPDIFEGIRELLAGRRALLCVDESQRVKNPRSRSFEALRELAPACERRVLLSGTPAPRDLADIWSQVFLLDDGERFGKKFYRWLGQVAELGNSYSDVAVRKYKPQESDAAIARVQELLLRRRKEDVLSLPEKTFITRDLELGGDQKKFYEEIRKELLVRVTSLTGATYLKEIQSVLEEYLRAVQVCSNPRLVDPAWNGDPIKFLECDLLLEEIVAERGEKVVIWTNYVRNVEELVLRYANYGARPFSGDVPLDERDATVREFQTGSDVKVIIAIPAAGGVGITLTAAQTAIYLDKTWNAEHYLQSVDRIHRIGQRGTVNIISLQASRVDALISKNLRNKEYFLRAMLGDVERGEMEPVTREELLNAVREQ